jgi:hypothetical protein
MIFLILENLKVTKFLNFGMKSATAITLLMLSGIQACTNNSANEKSKVLSDEYQRSETHFISNKIGWGIRLPGDDWQTIMPTKAKGIHTVAKDDLEWALAVELKDKNKEELISFRKDSLNGLLSFLQTYKSSNDKEYELMLTGVHEFFKSGYLERNIPAEYEMGATRIGGRMMDWFIIKERAVDASKKMLTVKLYNCLVGQYLLHIVSWSNNETDYTTLEKIIYSSTFSSED